MRKGALALTLGLALIAVPAAGDDKEDARRLYTEATDAFKNERFEEAARKFEAAAELRPHAVALYTAAQAWEAAKRPDRAADAYTLALKTPKLNEAQSSRARAQLASLEKEVGVVVVVGEKPARVQLDDHLEMEVPARVHGMPGEHGLLILREDGTSERRVVTLEKGEAVEIDSDEVTEETTDEPAKTVPMAEPVKKGIRVEPEPRSDVWKPVGYTTAGAGLALLTGGAVLGISAKGAEDAHNAGPTEDTFDHAKDLQKRTNILLGVGGGLTALGVGLVVWRSVAGGSSERAPSAEIQLSPTGLTARGRF